jgi:hypothetical protein
MGVLKVGDADKSNVVSSLSGRTWTTRPARVEFNDYQVLGFSGAVQPEVSFVAFPHWFLVIISVALTAVPWLRWKRRFSLRTLLVATTVVALALGLIIYATRG